MKKLVLGVALLASATAFAAPAAPQISHSRLSCVGVGANAKVIANIANASSARVYFSAHDGPEYYVEMFQRGANEFWAVLPIPERKTSVINYRIVARGEGNTEIATPADSVPVTSDCASFSLAREEKRFAVNLAIGQTRPNVALLEGFECYGVIATITIAGEMRPYVECDPRHAGPGTNLPVIDYDHVSLSRILP